MTVYSWASAEARRWKERYRIYMNMRNNHTALSDRIQNGPKNRVKCFVPPLAMWYNP